MATLKVNGDEFAKQLMDEVGAIDEEFTAFRADLIADCLSVAQQRTPKGKTGDLYNSWGAQPGRLAFGFKGQSGGQSGKFRASGPEVVRQFIRTTKPGDDITMGNSDFKANWFEYGTAQRSKDKNPGKKFGTRRIRGGANTGRINARYMLKVGIESVKDREQV